MSCSRTPFTNVASSKWMNNIPKIIESYGWKESELNDPTVELNSEVAEMLAPELKRLEQLLAKGHEGDDEDTLETTETIEISQSIIQDKWGKRWRKYVTRAMGADFKAFQDESIDPIDRILHPATFVAWDAMITATSDPDNCPRYVPFFNGGSELAKAQKYLAELLIGGISM